MAALYILYFYESKRNDEIQYEKKTKQKSSREWSCDDHTSALACACCINIKADFDLIKWIMYLGIWNCCYSGNGPFHSWLIWYNCVSENI